MPDDEAAHREMANDAGAHVPPGVIKNLMKMAAMVMTKLSYKL
jgi:demethoxyubiquinone hydroxylase (CLK1/Coq7/Cat5 family)